jgi:omega-6 fatty acid desaturase (delta-12 desaturase)
MHECGHSSLFKNKHLNVFFGFIFGIISGMPQFVWSRHHRYHHSTNGNWEKYRGPLNITTRDDYLAKTPKQQKQYCRARSIWLAPIAGFCYLIFTPRLNCLKASFSLSKQILQQKIAHPDLSIQHCAKQFKTPYCASLQEYFHMLANNILLISLWIGMAFLLTPSLFFICYIISLSLAGGLGIILFTVQHNFEHSYASNNTDWDYHQAALEGTSFLVLPCWLNWFTANIAYHHIHHLSASIPNYTLAACHHENLDLFANVTRIRLSQVPTALRYILWDTQARKIISIAEA